MITAGEHEFELWGLDSNVISIMLADRKGAMRQFIERSLLSAPRRGVPAISIWSILELRRHSEVYGQFLDFFSIYSFMLLKSPEHLFRDEISCYPNPSKVVSGLYAVTPFNRGKNSTLKPFLQKLFRKGEARQAERSWQNWKGESIAAIWKLKRSFPPRRDRYSEEDARRFVEEGVPQFVMRMAPDFARRIDLEGKVIDPDAFPSVKMQFYTVFHRFYIHGTRTPEDQDAFDILISGAAPYLDHVLSENFQADIYEKVKRRDPFLHNLDIGSIRSLRT